MMHHYDAATDVKTVVKQGHTYYVCILLINIISFIPFGIYIYIYIDIKFTCSIVYVLSMQYYMKQWVAHELYINIELMWKKII